MATEVTAAAPEVTDSVPLAMETAPSNENSAGDPLARVDPLVTDDERSPSPRRIDAQAAPSTPRDGPALLIQMLQSPKSEVDNEIDMLRAEREKLKSSNKRSASRCGTWRSRRAASARRRSS